MIPPRFLDLPLHRPKPRAVGLTHVLDKGLPIATVTGVLDAAADHVDIWKLGWGTAYVDPTVEAKLELLASRGVCSCLGGTLLEIAWAQGRAKDCLAWARDTGFAAVEVSRGVAMMSLAEKHALIEHAGESFVVLSEVGRKDAREEMPEQEWADEVVGDREAGARWVILEGRESGNVGLYRDDGRVRASIVAAVANAAGVEAVIFEAPRKDQQVWLLGQFGPDVNLANIAPDEAIPLETLRLGLRADTADLSRQWLPV